MKQFEGQKWAGTFNVSGRDIFGEISLNGPQTSLNLRDKDFFNPVTGLDQCIQGCLHDLRKVSLMNCIGPPVPGSAGRGDERYSFASVFPHYIVFGDNHIAPSDKTITAIDFVVDDASTLFYDFDAFGSLIDPEKFIDQIVSAQAESVGRNIIRGPYPQIYYFTGKQEIFSANTAIGRVSASHHPGFNFPGPRGIRVENTIVATLEFKEATSFHDSIVHTSTLLRYFGMLIGRPQNLLSLNLRIADKDDKPTFLQVYWSAAPRREESDKDDRPHPSDVLLDPIHQTDSFSKVIEGWLQRHESWRDARGRFFNSFDQQRTYGHDRLIGCANMFDILPSSALPPPKKLSAELATAIDSCRKIFTALPQGLERNGILDAFGRLGASNLKQKIHYRAKSLIDSAGDRFPELLMVINEAVNCRNHYVHGSDPRFNYEDNFHTVAFFTNTLQFVFAASDLIESGWDAKHWSATSSTLSHPFSSYRFGYAENLKILKALLS